MDTIEFLKANEQKGSGTFLKEAQYLKENWGWLKYSYAIALKVRRRMEDLGWTQKRLSEVLGCTQQHVSVLLAGKANMTLETLAKLENALQFDLIGALLTPSGSSGILSEPPSEDDYIISGTSSSVAGYPVRKKKGPSPKSAANQPEK